MRDHAVMTSQFWVGETGRELRGDKEAQIVAAYLITGPSSTMIGLYHLALPTLCHETGLSQQGASKGLARCEEVGFAHYDPLSETIFVPEMAKFQLGAALSLKDNRFKAVQRLAVQMRKSPFFKAFLDLYAEPYHLDRGALEEASRAEKVSPSKAPSEPLGSPSEGVKKKESNTKKEKQGQEQEQEQGQGQDDSSEPLRDEAASKPASVMTFPTVGKGGKEYHLTAEALAQYERSFPALNVMDQFRRAKQWLLDNAAKKKTAGGMPKFLGGWLGRAQNRGAGTGSAKKGSEGGRIRERTFSDDNR